jgi:hypothetical protein
MFDGHGLERRAAMPDHKGSLVRHNLQGHVLSCDLLADIVRSQIHGHTAIRTYGCRTKMFPSMAVSQASGSTICGSVGNGGKVGKATRGGTLRQARP